MNKNTTHNEYYKSLIEIPDEAQRLELDQEK